MPGQLFFIAFISVPMVSAVLLNFFDWTGRGTRANCVDLGNFGEALSSPEFYRAAGNIVFFVKKIDSHGVFLVTRWRLR